MAQLVVRRGGEKLIAHPKIKLQLIGIVKINYQLIDTTQN